MKLKKYVVLGLMVVIIILGSTVSHELTQISNTDNEFGIHSSEPTQSLTNNEILNDIFNNKILAYISEGYFPQIYETSLQATYYALFILNKIGKINEFNFTELSSYIMSHYDSNLNRFMDSLAYRYLDTDFSLTYYPLSTVLETTCYAILSLEILGALNLVDTQELIDFIWGCYNPVTSGFIGQTYDTGLEDRFKVSTMDNTYFAVITLDMLMDDWNAYTTQRNALTQYINDLQIPVDSFWGSGGFPNDDNVNFESLKPIFEPNLLSSFYCVKTLEVFGMENTINTPDFNHFLNNSYDHENDYFHISPFDYPENYTNIVASGLGLELSDITGFSEIKRNDVISFILDNRNSLGNWDHSTTIPHHELIDTFQIIRSLENTQELSQLSLQDKNQIGNATYFYFQENSFSHLSKDYTSMNLLHSIISSFGLFGRSAELDIQTFYTQIKNSFRENYQQEETNSFMAYLSKSTVTNRLRSFPIEYYNINGNPISLMASHKHTFNALDSLKQMFKLDDFSSEADLNELVADIVATQFLNDTYYQTFGGFSPLWPYSPPFNSSFLSSVISLEYSYYVIRCLELLVEQLTLGDLSATGVDTMALYSYIDRNIIETSTELFFNPQYPSNPETLLENTYYMIYILKAIDLYNKDIQKITNFVMNNLDYTNIKNIYFSYKISEILGVDFDFDTDLTYGLVQDIYSEDLREFYLTSDRVLINQEAFLWISEMARNSIISIEVQYPSEVSLGSTTTISAILSNLILRDFGTYITFKFESEPLGTQMFSKIDGDSYTLNLYIPFSSDYYPEIEGTLCAYEGTQKKAELSISFCTSYSLNYTLTTSEGTGIKYIEVNASVSNNESIHAISDGKVFTQIYKDDEFVKEAYFSCTNFTEYSMFLFNYSPTAKGIYHFKVYLDDGIQEDPINIGNTTFYMQVDIITESYDQEIELAIPLMITFIAAPGSLIIISSKQLKKSRKKLKYN